MVKTRIGNAFLQNIVGVGLCTFLLLSCQQTPLGPSQDHKPCCQADTSRWTGGVYVNTRETQYDLEDLASNLDKPIQKARITIGQQSYETDDKGQFSIPKTQPEETLTVSHPGYLSYQTTLQKSVNAFEIYLSKYSEAETLSEKRAPKAVYGLITPALPDFFTSDATKKLKYAIFKSPLDLEPLWRFLATEPTSKLFKVVAENQAASQSQDEVKKGLEAELQAGQMLVAVTSHNLGPTGIHSPINSIFENSSTLIFSNHYSSMKVLDPLSEKANIDTFSYTIQLFAIQKTDKQIQFDFKP